jgi:hypothetical protein
VKVARPIFVLISIELAQNAENHKGLFTAVLETAVFLLEYIGEFLEEGLVSHLFKQSFTIMEKLGE